MPFKMAHENDNVQEQPTLNHCDISTGLNGGPNADGYTATNLTAYVANSAGDPPFTNPKPSTEANGGLPTEHVIVTQPAILSPLTNNDPRSRQNTPLTNPTPYTYSANQNLAMWYCFCCDWGGTADSCSCDPCCCCCDCGNCDCGNCDCSGVDCSGCGACF